VWLLPTVIDRFSRQYPRVTVRIFQPDTITMDFHELHERSVELVLARLPRTFTDNDLDSEILFDDPRFVVTAARSHWARQRKVTLADLRSEPWIVPPWASAVEAIEKSFEAEGLAPPTVRVVAASIYLRIHLLATGRFITVMADSVLRGVAKQLSFKILPITLRVKSLPIAVVRLKKRTLSPVAQLFLDHLRAVVKSM
jgi:DNA-binding transcriptional LysR family regulator